MRGCLRTTLFLTLQNIQLPQHQPKPNKSATLSAYAVLFCDDRLSFQKSVYQVSTYGDKYLGSRTARFDVIRPRGTDE